jgi:hypothetical protein
MLTPAAHVLLSGDWVTPRYIARLWGRTTRQVRRWCANGYLAQRHCAVFQDQTGRWWIRLADTNLQPPLHRHLTRSDMSPLHDNVPPSI